MGPAGKPPVIDPLTCTACGLCVVACPADALGEVGPGASELVGAAADAGPTGLTVRCLVAGRDPAPTGPVFYVGCLGSVDPEALASAACVGPVLLQHTDCAACPVAPEERVAAVVVAGARLAASLPRAAEVSDEAVPPSGVRATAGRPRAVSRRALVSDRTPAPRASARELLLDADADAPLPQVAVGDACTGCRACAKVCPTDALTATWNARGVTLSFDARVCAGCGECARVCGEDAIEVVGRRRGPHEPQVVARVRATRCTRCEALLAPGEVGECARCRGRRGLLDDVWAKLG